MEAAAGYDYEFVNSDIPSEYICLICTLVARDAQQSGCCGRIFCKDCLELLEKIGHRFTCPNCRKELTKNYFTDKNSIRMINNLKVYCPNKLKGCTWTGELQQVGNHTSECPHQLLPCPNGCGTTMSNSDLKVHLNQDCPRRIIRCICCFVCGEYQFITGAHLLECPRMVIPCPNDGCDSKIERQELDNHREFCLYELILCINNCGEEFIRRIEPTHLQEECPSRIVECPYCDMVGMFSFIHDEDHFNDCPDYPWPCPNNGCKDTFKYHAREAHMSVCLKQLIKCKYSMVCRDWFKREDEQRHYHANVDRHLSAMYTRLQQLEDGRCSNERTIQSVSGELQQVKTMLINVQSSMAEINTRIGECSVDIAMTKAVIKRQEGRLANPIILKLKLFGSMKENNEKKTFEFYFRPHDYKFRFVVFANGLGKAKTTHVSVRLEVINGDHDDLLHGPFLGMVWIKLLNQRADERHKDAYINFAERHKDSSGKVLQSFTIHHFCPHDSLSFNGGQMEYLRNDLLYFKLHTEIPPSTKKKWLTESYYTCT